MEMRLKAPSVRTHQLRSGKRSICSAQTRRASGFGPSNSSNYTVSVPGSAIFRARVIPPWGGLYPESRRAYRITDLDIGVGRTEEPSVDSPLPSVVADEVGSRRAA